MDFPYKYTRLPALAYPNAGGSISGIIKQKKSACELEETVFHRFAYDEISRLLWKPKGNEHNVCRFSVSSGTMLKITMIVEKKTNFGLMKTMNIDCVRTRK